MSRRHEHPLFRFTALVAALCVLMLAVFAASPVLHAELHEHDHAGLADHPAIPGPDQHACAVTLFANGIIALLVICLLMLVRPLAAGVFLRATDAWSVARPRYWLVPSHAPPAA